MVDDDKSLATSMVLNLENEGYSVESASTAEACLSKVDSTDFQVIFCDLLLPDANGLELIKGIKSRNSNAALILMSGRNCMDLLDEAIESGASDLLAKPFSVEQLLFVLRKAEKQKMRAAKQTESVSASGPAQKFTVSNIIAQSESMKCIFETVKRLANFNTTILITGESGTGKELIARAIHHNSSRRNKPFVAINCGAIPENLMESELFGHKKGSFTDATRDKKGLFEEASGGTIFLDEIGEMPLHLQVKLLRALQEQRIRRVGDEETIPVDLRIVAATLRNLEEDIASGRFRDDLYYRLNVVSINVPPLRERPDDISILVNHFIKKHSRLLGLSVKGVTEAAMERLLSYRWRGNVRELENCIERAIVLSESGYIDLDDMPEIVRSSKSSSENRSFHGPITDDNLSIKQRTRNLEIELILRALKKTNGNRTHAAKILEISHRALLYKLKDYGLTE